MAYRRITRIKADIVPAGVGIRPRVAMHVPIAVEPIGHRIRAGELPGYRIIVPRVVVVQPARPIGMLPGEAIGGRRRPAAVARAAIGRVELLVGDAARSVERLRVDARLLANVDKLLVDKAVAAPEEFDNQANIESKDVAGVDQLWDIGQWDFSFTSLK